MKNRGEPRWWNDENQKIIIFEIRIRKKNNVSGAGKLTRFHIFFMVLAYSTVRASQNHMICSIIRKYLAGRHCRCIFVPKSLAEIHYRHGTMYRYRVGSGRNNKNRRNQSKKYMTSSDSPDQFTPAWTPTFPALFPFHSRSPLRISFKMISSCGPSPVILLLPSAVDHPTTRTKVNSNGE